MTGQTIVGYRRGDHFSLAPAPGARPVLVILNEGVRLRHNPLCGCFVCRDGCPYGTGLMAALKLGWCRVSAEG